MCTTPAFLNVVWTAFVSSLRISHARSSILSCLECCWECAWYSFAKCQDALCNNHLCMCSAHAFELACLCGFEHAAFILKRVATSCNWHFGENGIFISVYALVDSFKKWRTLYHCRMFSLPSWNVHAQKEESASHPTSLFVVRKGVTH